MARYIDGDALSDFCKDRISHLEKELVPLRNDCIDFVKNVAEQASIRQKKINQHASGTTQRVFNKKKAKPPAIPQSLLVEHLEQQREEDSIAHDLWIPILKIETEMAVLKKVLEEIVSHQELTAV